MTYIRCGYARGACNCLDYLRSIGITASVGYRDKPKDRKDTLIVHYRGGDRSKIPATFQDFKIVVEFEKDWTE